MHLPIPYTDASVNVYQDLSYMYTFISMASAFAPTSARVTAELNNHAAMFILNKLLNSDEQKCRLCGCIALVFEHCTAAPFVACGPFVLHAWMQGVQFEICACLSAPNRCYITL